MAKVAKVKKRGRGTSMTRLKQRLIRNHTDISVHSRAARRGDPTADEIKSKKQPVIEESDYKPWIHSAHNAGVGKRKTKQLTRQQRHRQQRGLEKAEVNLDKLDKKVADSKTRGKKVNARRADWEELNARLPGKPVKENRVASAVDEAAKPMEDVVTPDLAQPLDVEAAVSAAPVPTARITAEGLAPPSENEEDVDEIL